MHEYPDNTFALNLSWLYIPYATVYVSTFVVLCISVLYKQCYDKSYRVLVRTSYDWYDVSYVVAGMCSVRTSLLD